MFDLVNIFDIFLPQLLLYPNPKDPLNGEAANLLLKDQKKYNDKVKDYVKKFAQKDSIEKIEKTKLNVTSHEKNTSAKKEEKKEEDELSELSETS